MGLHLFQRDFSFSFYFAFIFFARSTSEWRHCSKCQLVSQLGIDWPPHLYCTSWYEWREQVSGGVQPSTEWHWWGNKRETRWAKRKELISVWFCFTSKVAYNICIAIASLFGHDVHHVICLDRELHVCVSRLLFIIRAVSSAEDWGCNQDWRERIRWEGRDFQSSNVTSLHPRYSLNPSLSDVKTIWQKLPRCLVFFCILCISLPCLRMPVAANYITRYVIDSSVNGRKRKEKKSGWAIF